MRSKGSRSNPAGENRRRQVDWFQSSDESVQAVMDWDIKAHQLAAAVLGVLSKGDAIMFGVSFAGDAISMTIYSGEVKSRKWVADSIEFDDLTAVIAQRARGAQTQDISQLKEAAAD